MLLWQPVAANVLQPLLSMAALTSLDSGWLDDAGFATAAELTQLRQLTVWEQASTTDAGLLQLTQLRQLTHLHVVHQDAHEDRFKGKVRCCLATMLFQQQLLETGVTGAAHC
jgi:hypothetical protein